MENFGALANKNLSRAEIEVYGEFLQRTLNSPAIEFIRYFLGDDYLKFIDILAGTTFKIPTYKTLERDIESVRMFVSAFQGRFDEGCLKGICKSYGKNINQVKRSVGRVARVLGTEDIIEGVTKENYINNIVKYLESLYECESSCTEEAKEEVDTDIPENIIIEEETIDE